MGSDSLHLVSKIAVEELARRFRRGPTARTLKISKLKVTQVLRYLLLSLLKIYHCKQAE